MPKPTAISSALRRSGAGWSLMLAEIAPSVAGWPPAKPNKAEAIRLTAITPAATLTPLRMCWPTNSFSRAGERSQWRMRGGSCLGKGGDRRPSYARRGQKSWRRAGRPAASALRPSEGSGSVAVHAFSRFSLGNRSDSPTAFRISLCFRSDFQTFPKIYLAESGNFRRLAPKKFGNRVFWVFDGLRWKPACSTAEPRSSKLPWIPVFGKDLSAAPLTRRRPLPQPRVDRLQRLRARAEVGLGQRVERRR